MINKIILFTILSFYSISIFSQSTASPQVSSFEFPFNKENKKIWIYLPDGYEESSKQYPVFYMHDAQNLFDKQTSYVGEWQVDESLDSLQEPKAIIVGIEHGGDKRIDELTPFSNEKYGGGKGDIYVDFIVNKLKPHIDSNYRTLKDKANTGIFGSSLGGLISFYAALEHSNVFGMVGVYSPSFWFSEKIFDFTENITLDQNTKFYFLVGTEESEEMVPDMKRMVDLLKDKGLKECNIKTKYVEGGKHNESLWAENFTETYLWLITK